MLALAISVAFAIYILGPDAFSRFVLDFSVPRRAVTLTKSEEIYRAVAWGGISLYLAYLWERWSGTLDKVWRWDDLRTVFAGIYSEQFFRENQDKWFHSLNAFWWMNWCLAWRLYFVVLLLSVTLCLLIHWYAALRFRFRGDRWYQRYARNVLAAFILPRIAPWHLLLSRIYVREEDVKIHLDVLTKMDILYQGRFEEKSLTADGTLLSLTLGDPKRFLRDEYMEAKTEAKKSGNSTDSKQYWKPIPTNIFVLMGAEVHSINVRYVQDVSALKRRPRSSNFAAQLEELRLAVEAIKKAHPGMAVSLSDSAVSDTSSSSLL